MSDVHKLTGAYALDALDDIERARFEQHLAECEDCRAEVAEMRETAALLAETSAVTPPDSLRSSVLAGISQVRPLPPEVPRTTTPIDIRSAQPAGRRGWMPFLVAAALALFVGIGATVTQPWQSDEVPQLTAAEQVIEAPDAQEVFVDLGEAGRATVVRSKDKDRAVITTEDMVAAPAGKVYELWLMSPEGVFTSAGLMPDAADQTLVLEGSAATASAVGITVEPDGGSEKPTTEPIALFDLTEAT
ncbi:Anti-sigma-K factor RskA [Nocardioides alpinus]|uniref:Regulator of SigK n=1 Tax=Nocardioides alpinus TaxID=748909 RepID=A0A1I0WJS7_9ACTN|nr:anti-sigma factor [Nocardioides alpinus]PKH37951.1 anti-sigma factor [Nocardioides alpinus]SFA88390.1 Anti-sigma-K factor RskA [Nocardioides alpinus]